MMTIPELLWNHDKKAWMNYPGDTQERVLMQIVRENEGTLFGREYLFREIKDIEDFTRYVPLSMYGDVQPYIQTMVGGEPNILVAQPVKRWMKANGTCGARLFPYTAQVARIFQDAFLRVYTACAAEGRVLEGKIVAGLEGVSPVEVGGLPVGSFSSLWFEALKKIPVVGSMVIPSEKTAALADAQDRWLSIAVEASKQNVTAAVADPILFLAFLRRMMTDYKEVLNCSDIEEMWPSFSLVISQCNTAPFNRAVHSLMKNAEFREIFCTDELILGIQVDEKGYIPLYDHCFLEFISLKEWNEMEQEGGEYREYTFDSRIIENAQRNQEYVLAVTTPGGLYRYITGDVVTILDDLHIERTGWIEPTPKGAAHVAEQHMVLLREIAREELDITMGAGNQVVAVESEALSYLFGIR